MEGELGNRHACAACKHQRRKCRQDCVFPPYFPGDKLEEFQLAHKIFGVNNLAKIIKNPETRQARETAVESIKWEAAMWKEDPVHGPLGAYQNIKRENAEKDQLIIQLQQKISSYEAIMTSSGSKGTPNDQGQDHRSWAEAAAPTHVFMNQETNNRGKGIVSYMSPVTSYRQPAAALEECYNGDNYCNNNNNCPVGILPIIMEQQQPLRAVQGRSYYGGSYYRANDQPQGDHRRVIQGRGGEYYHGVASNGPFYDAPPLHGPSHLPQLRYPQNNYYEPRTQICPNNFTTLLHQQHE